MADLRQHFVVLASMLLCSYFTCQQVSGIALQQPEGKREMTTSSKFSPAFEGRRFTTDNGKVIEMFPISEPHLRLEFNTSRRKLGQFLTCSTCTCCDSTGAKCLEGIPCCFTIDCSVQPYGVCKFVPVSCSCSGC